MKFFFKKVWSVKASEIWDINFLKFAKLHMKKTSYKHEGIEWNVSRLPKHIKCKQKKPPPPSKKTKKHSKNIDSRRLTQPRLEPRDALGGSSSDQGISTSNSMLQSPRTNDNNTHVRYGISVYMSPCGLWYWSFF